jgi:hypothetical protein
MEAGKDSYLWKPGIEVQIGGRILGHEGLHSMGMYPFVKYLDERYPNDPELYVRIIKETLLSESKTPMEGIINAIDEPEYLWWPGFFEKYLTRQLEDVPADEFLKLFPGIDFQVDFFKEKDTIRMNVNEYADLSAKLYKINFVFPGFQNEASLNLKVTPSNQSWDYVTAMAFGMKDNRLEYFDQAGDLTVTGLKTLTENDYEAIVVAVVNSYSVPAINETIDITLESELQTTPGRADENFFEVDMNVDLRATFIESAGGTHEDEYSWSTIPRSGGLSGNTFTASWNIPSDGWSYAGTIELEFDPERYPEYYIIRYSIEETASTSVYSQTTQIKGENIDLKGYKTDLYDRPCYYFYTYNTDACNYITSVDIVERDENGSVTSYTDGNPLCDELSFLWIKLYYQEE